jgi:hypothetical protein
VFDECVNAVQFALQRPLVFEPATEHGSQSTTWLNMLNVVDEKDSGDVFST